MNLKKIFNGKRFGFYVTLALTLLSLITGIVYLACYAGTRDFSLWAAITMLAGFVLALVLILFNQAKYVPYVLGILVFASLLLYVEGIYLYVSEVMVGIDETEFSSQFLASTVFYVITFVVALVNVFLPQVKAPVIEENKEKEAVNE